MTLWILIGVTAAGSLYSMTRPPSLDGGWRAAWWFLLPSLIGFLAFFLIPMIRGIYLGFTDWNALSNSGEWIGPDNYTKLIDDAQFWNAMRVTFWYVIWNIGTQTVLAITIAVMMDRLTKSGTVRSLILLPWLIPNLVAGLLFLWLLDPNLGLVNDILGWFGLGPYRFLTSTSGVIPSLALMNTWKFMGYTALLIFAGLQTIPKNLYEAAAIDGATEWQMMRRITIPLMRPVLALVMVVTVVGSFQVFDTALVAGGGIAAGGIGGPVNASKVIYLYIYQNAFVFFDQGYASALASVLLVFLMIITAIQLRLFRANESDLA
ncbi:MAG: sugar ABC transporter permease [Actinomycetota bacterium]